MPRCSNGRPRALLMPFILLMENMAALPIRRTNFGFILRICLNTYRRQDFICASVGFFPRGGSQLTALAKYGLWIPCRDRSARMRPLLPRASGVSPMTITSDCSCPRRISHTFAHPTLRRHRVQLLSRIETLGIDGGGVTVSSNVPCGRDLVNFHDTRKRV